MSLEFAVRRAVAADAHDIGRVIAAAFVGEPEVVDLERALAQRDDHVGFVAEHDGVIVGHVGLTRCWIDATERLVEALVLSPLSAVPELQRSGIGRTLLQRAIEHGGEVGAPAVFLEGNPAYYSRVGWRPTSEIGITPASPRIPPRASQFVLLPSYEPWMRGPLVYPETFWLHDAVGLRGERLDQALGRQ